MTCETIKQTVGHGISVGDTVRVDDTAPDGVLSYVETVSRSSHATVRVRLSEFTVDDDGAKALISEIERPRWGCRMSSAAHHRNRRCGDIDSTAARRFPHRQIT